MLLFYFPSQHRHREEDSAGTIEPQSANSVIEEALQIRYFQALGFGFD